MRYKKPVLIELFAECYFTPSTFSAVHVMDVVTGLRSKGFNDIELVEGLQMGVEQPAVQSRIRCWSPGRKKLLQLSEDCLIVNLVGEYPGWSPFVELADLALGLAAHSVRDLSLKSVNLNTIDRFTVPRASYLLDQYVNVGGKIVPGWYKGSKEALDLTLGWGLLNENGWNKQVNVRVRCAEAVTIEFRAAHHKILASGLEWKSALNELHEQSNVTFEALITDKTRNEVMGGTIN
jgi:uncharacterized protein (TIGR04255 family)